MTPEQIQQLIDAFVQVGGILAQRGFELAMRQTLVTAMLDISIGGIGLILVAIFAPRVFRFAIFYSGAAGFMVALSVAAVTALLMLILFSGISAALVPEWEALELLLQLAK